jgi:hypothetical protein
MEHGAESYSPRIFFRRALLDQDWDATVYGFGQFGIPARAKDGAGSGIWIEKGDILSGKGETTIFLEQILNLVSKESKFGSILRASGSRQG